MVSLEVRPVARIEPRKRVWERINRRFPASTRLLVSTSIPHFSQTNNTQADKNLETAKKLVTKEYVIFFSSLFLFELV